MFYRKETNQEIALRLIAEHYARKVERDLAQRDSAKATIDAWHRAQRLAEEEQADRIRAHAMGVRW
jgi:hypothetical protein